jgi:hypothetical protein
MKKPIAAAVLVLLAVGGAGLWYAFRLWQRPSHSKIELRAMMRDEDAPREIVPSVGLQVNDDRSAEVAVGTPLWFTVGVDNAAALNEISAAQAISERLARLPANAPGRARLQANYQQRSAPAKITLGDAAHPWTEAVQLLVRDAQGAEHPLNFPAPRVGKPTPVVSLDAFRSEQASFGTPAAAAPPGTYSIVACLGETGSWHGRACSEPVQLTIQEPPPARLAPDRQSIVDRRAGRFALMAGDASGLEQAGRKLIAAEAGGVEGHLYLGEALYMQGHGTEALEEFTTARANFRRGRPGDTEPSLFLNARINHILTDILQRPAH